MKLLQKNKQIFEYEIDAHDKIVFVNQDWLTFAIENDAHHLTRDNVVGKSLWHFIHDKESIHLYQILLDKVRRQRKTFRFPFRCDSDKMKRFMEMKIEILEGNTIKFLTWVVKEEQKTNPHLPPTPQAVSEFLTICSWCQLVKVDDQWMEVEDAIAHLNLYSQFPLPQLTHDICNPCRRKCC